jgi:hypothetical protein
MTPHLSDGYVVDFPGVSMELLAPPSADGNHRRDASAVAEALTAMSAVLRPLAIDASLYGHDAADQTWIEARHPQWHIVDQSARDALGLEPTRSGARRVVVDVLTPARVESSLNDALAEELPAPSAVFAWDEVAINATEARLPRSLATRRSVVLDTPGGDIGGCVHERMGESWLRACWPDDLPPFRLRFSGPSPFRLTITTFWSIWLARGPGSGDIQQAVTLLCQQGWRLNAVDSRWGFP